MPRDPASRARRHLTPWAAIDERGVAWVKLPSRQRLLKLSESDVVALEALLPVMRRQATEPQTAPCEVLEVVSKRRAPRAQRGRRSGAGR